MIEYLRFLLRNKYYIIVEIIVGRYLATFAHRYPMYWWVFAIALVAVLAVTIGVVVIRSWKAATADPANALKTE
ncbi:MAG: hypothetical protein Q4D10_02330 [Bacteroidales bacterium]|nr:hypothetical protein [Bacteroidales bacterium]